MSDFDRTARRLLTRTAETLIAAADQYDGLFPSVLTRDGARIPPALGPAIEGQRDGDRSYPGNNLMHDHPLLRTLLGLDALLGDTDYTPAVERYLQRFATHCTATDSGLFPWGEHSFWNLVEDRPGNSYVFTRRAQRVIHDHLHAAPPWLWERLWQYNAEAVTAFCRGLDRHYKNDARTEYIRHAPILGPCTRQIGRAHV